MRKIFLVVFAVVLFSIIANSQIKFGVDVGTTISNRTGYKTDPGPDVKPLITLCGSVFSNIVLGNSFNLQPSIGYQPKGNKFINLTFEDQLGNDLGKGNMSFRFDYLQLTVPLQYLISENDKMKLFTCLGPYIAYAVGGRETWKNVSGPPSNEPKKRKIPFGDNGSKRFDAGFTVMLSTLIQNNWMLSINYEPGFVNTNSNAQIKSHNMSAGLTVGYLFK